MNTPATDILIDRDRIAQRVRQLSQRIAEDFRRATADNPDAEITIIAILTGSLIFLSDLVRQLPLKMRIRLIAVSSYPGTSTTSQGVRLEGQLPDDLRGQHVLVIDDILDSGRTLDAVHKLTAPQRPASLRACVLLDKQIKRAVAVEADYVGFEIPDTFVVGYGLDFNGYYRNLPDLMALTPAMAQGDGA